MGINLTTQRTQKLQIQQRNMTRLSKSRTIIFIQEKVNNKFIQKIWTFFQAWQQDEKYRHFNIMNEP